jgi:hypothetical protein
MTDFSPDHFNINREEKESAIAPTHVLITLRDRADAIERAVLSALTQAVTIYFLPSLLRGFYKTLNKTPASRGDPGHQMTELA